MAAMAAEKIHQQKLNGDFHSDSNLTHGGVGTFEPGNNATSQQQISAYNSRKAAVVRARLAVPGGQRLLLKVCNYIIVRARREASIEDTARHVVVKCYMIERVGFGDI